MTDTITATLIPALAPVPALTEGYVSRVNKLLTDSLASCTLAGEPFAGVRAVRVTVSHNSSTDDSIIDHAEVYRDDSPAPAWMVKSEPYDVIEDREALEWADFYGAFFTLWCVCAEDWYRFDCANLHPDTRWEFDPMAIGKECSALHIGMARTTDPDGPLDFDPTKSSWSVDQGVISFPLHGTQTVAICEEGYGHLAAGRMQLLRILVAAYVHEAFELWQHSPGNAWINPHRCRDQIAAEIEYADGSVFPLYI